MLWCLLLIVLTFTERIPFSTGLPTYNLDIFVCRTDSILTAEAPAGHVTFEYSASKDCSLRIQAPRGNIGSRFLLNFESLRVGSRDRGGCGQEELRIYNGATTSGESYLSVCGESQEQVLSTGSTVTFRLEAEGDVQGGSFLVLYTLVHEAVNGVCPQHSHLCMDVGCLSEDVYGDGECNCPDGSDESDTGVCEMTQGLNPREDSSGWTQYQPVLNSSTLSTDAEMLYPSLFNGDETLPEVQDDTEDVNNSRDFDQQRNKTMEKGGETGELQSPTEHNSAISVVVAVSCCVVAVAAVAGVLGWLKFKAKSRSRVGVSV